MERRVRNQWWAVPVALLVVVSVAAPAVGEWQDGQNAEYVLGQTDFTSNSSGTSSTTLNYPGGVAVDVANGKLYVSDNTNARVLRYAYPITSNGQAAELVFGQSNFTSSMGSNQSNKFSSPIGIAVDASGRLWVADTLNHRVVWFDSAYAESSNGPIADGVLGQAEFNQSSINRGGSPAADTMYAPYSVHVDATDRLWVADENNNRVLWFDNASSVENGAPADGVLGQINFTDNGENQGGSPSAGTLSDPCSATVDGAGRLWVADGSNHRVLRFDGAASLASGAAADAVLGQSDFASNDSNRGGSVAANTLYRPTTAVVDGAGRLYVADQNNHRILIYNDAVSKANGAGADNVLGQSLFSTSGFATTQAGLNAPFGLALDDAGGKLVTADLANNRALQFDAGMTLPVTVSSFQVE